MLLHVRSSLICFGALFLIVWHSLGWLTWKRQMSRYDPVHYIMGICMYGGQCMKLILCATYRLYWSHCALHCLWKWQFLDVAILGLHCLWNAQLSDVDILGLHCLWKWQLLDVDILGLYCLWKAQLLDVAMQGPHCLWKAQLLDVVILGGTAYEKNTTLWCSHTRTTRPMNMMNMSSLI